MTAPDAGPPRRGRLVLASASPRRSDLLASIGVACAVRPAHVDETARPGETADALVERLSRAKATAVPLHPGEVVVAADTVVEVDGAVLGKPVDASDAAAMLGALSGRTHRVLTGLAVRPDPAVFRPTDDPDSGLRSVTTTTAVTFAALTAADIAWYIGSGEPFGKAGGYAIQGAGGLFVTGIVGSYHNVVGLPLAVLASMFSDLGLTLV